MCMWKERNNFMALFPSYLYVESRDGTQVARLACAANAFTGWALSLTSELLPYLKLSSNHRMSSKWERLSLDWKMQQFHLEAIFERESAVWSNLWSFSIWAWGRPCCLLPSPRTETVGRHLSSRKARWPINVKDYHHQNTSHLNWVCLAVVSSFHEVALSSFYWCSLRYKSELKPPQP